MGNTDNSSIQKEKGTAEFLLACSKNFVASAGTAGVRILVRIQKLNRWTGNGEIQHGSAGDTHTNNQECGSPEGSSQDLPCAAGTARQAESPALPCASSPGCPSWSHGAGAPGPSALWGAFAAETLLQELQAFHLGGGEFFTSLFLYKSCTFKWKDFNLSSFTFLRHKPKAKAAQPHKGWVTLGSVFPVNTKFHQCLSPDFVTHRKCQGLAFQRQVLQLKDFI